ncbi:Molybdenum-containing formylmethanofuran dehydrogenase 1 subunit C [uncultured archaeon]|nr:Molybdenum-containing formylmethanofuran dehydrogenase 1 subunit C [uncultured archaeon]
MDNGIVNSKNELLAVTGKNNFKFTRSLSSLGLLEKFVPQESCHKVREPKVRKASRRALVLMRTFERFLTVHEKYMEDKAAKHAKSVVYGAKDIEEFSLILPSAFRGEEHFGRYASYFLNALVGKCRSGEDEFTIHTTNFQHAPDNIGRGLSVRKKLTVIGNVGVFAGVMMEGEMHIFGNAGNYAGCLGKGSAMVIEGSCGEKLGDCLRSGRITVKGSAGDGCGSGMKDGEIEVMGDAGGDIGSNGEGKITVHGKNGGVSNTFKGEFWDGSGLAWKDGKPVRK